MLVPDNSIAVSISENIASSFATIFCCIDIDGTLISTSIVLFATSTVFIGLGLVAEMVTRVLPQNSRIYPFDASDEHN